MEVSPRSTEREGPWIDNGRRFRHGDRAVPLSPSEAAVARVLLASIGRVVSRARLQAALEVDGPRGHRALDSVLHRLRGRLASLGIEVRAVRARGVLLVAVAEPAAVRAAG
jgi:DNA-binding response OmpR family regulator